MNMQERMYLGEEGKHFVLLVNMCDVIVKDVTVIDIDVIENLLTGRIRLIKRCDL